MSLADGMKAALFDLGGTLIEFENQPWDQLERIGMTSVYEKLRLGEHADISATEFADAFVRFHSELRRRTRVDNIERTFDRVCSEFLISTGIITEMNIEEFVRVFYKPIEDQLRLIDDAVELLGAVRQRGLKVGLVSNSPFAANVHRREMERFGIYRYFDHTVFSSELGIRKPDSSIFKACLDALGVEPNEAFHVGDRPIEDIQGAQACGIRAIMIRRPDRVLPDSIKPDYIVDRLEEIANLL